VGDLNRLKGASARLASAPLRSWGCSNTAVATVNSTGLATAVAAGTAKITATFTGVVYPFAPSGFCSPVQRVTKSGSSTCDVVCPVPTNFAQSGVGSSSNGLLAFTYTWSSTTGNTTDLSKCSCKVGEEVDYPGFIPGTAATYVWPRPPWSQSTTNPAVDISQAATLLPLSDVHHPGTMIAPYGAAQFSATQYYKYVCTGVNNGSPVTLLGPISINRSVTQNSNGTFTYTFTKSGQTASCTVGQTCTQ